LEYQRPQFLTASAVELGRWNVCQGFQECLLLKPVALPQLVKNLVGSYDRVLDIGSALSLETQRLLEIERNHLSPRELDHEVADGGNRDHLRVAACLLLAKLRVSLADLGAGGSHERVEEVVSFHAQPLSTGHFDERTLGILRIRGWRVSK